MPLLAFSAGLMTKQNPAGSVDDASNLVGTPELVRALLESKASVDARTESGSTALHLACASGLAEHVRVLLEHDTDVNASTDDHNRPTALMLLMQTSPVVTDEWRLECLDLLAGSKKLEIDRKDDAGYTPFVAAVEWGRSAEVLHALLAHGADVNAQTVHPGFTALAAASAPSDDSQAGSDAPRAGSALAAARPSAVTAAIVAAQDSGTLLYSLSLI